MERKLSQPIALVAICLEYVGDPPRRLANYLRDLSKLALWLLARRRWRPVEAVSEDDDPYLQVKRPQPPHRPDLFVLILDYKLLLFIRLFALVRLDLDADYLVAFDSRLELADAWITPVLEHNS